MLFSGGFRTGAMLKTTILGAPGDSRSPVLIGRGGAGTACTGGLDWRPRSDLESRSALLCGPCFKGRSKKNTPHSHYRVCTNYYSISLFWTLRGNTLFYIFLYLSSP